MVTCTGTAAFDTASVGAGKTVTVSGLTLTGAAAGNYTLASTTATTTAAITAATLTPTVAVANKVVRRHDERDAHELHAGGVIGGDVVSCTGTAAFDTASVGAGKTVTVSGLTLTGADAGNYTLASTTATTTATITAATVTPVVTVANKPYRRHDERDGDELHADGRGRRRRGELHGHGGVRHGERRRGQDGDGERAEPDGRGRGELRAGEHDGDDDRRRLRR